MLVSLVVGKRVWVECSEAHLFLVWILREKGLGEASIVSQGIKHSLLLSCTPTRETS